MTKGWNEKRHAFTQFYGSEDLDASLLINMCSFWPVEALTRAGLAFPEKLDHARLLFERVLGYANHLGLYAEQTGPQGRGTGQFPAGLYTSRVDQRRIQSGPYAGRLEWGDASLAMKHR